MPATEIEECKRREQSLLAENHRLFVALGVALRVCRSAARGRGSEPSSGQHLCPWKDQLDSLTNFARKTNQELLRRGVDSASVSVEKLRYPVTNEPYHVPGDPYTGLPMVSCCSAPKFKTTKPTHYICKHCYAEFITEE